MLLCYCGVTKVKKEEEEGIYIYFYAQLFDAYVLQVDLSKNVYIFVDGPFAFVEYMHVKWAEKQVFLHSTSLILSGPKSRRTGLVTKT